MTVLLTLAVITGIALCFGAGFAMYGWMSRNPINRAPG
jgi:hypothetical protein